MFIHGQAQAKTIGLGHQAFELRDGSHSKRIKQSLQLDALIINWPTRLNLTHPVYLYGKIFTGCDNR